MTEEGEVLVLYRVPTIYSIPTKYKESEWETANIAFLGLKTRLFKYYSNQPNI